MAAVNSHTGRRLWFITPHGLAMSASPVRLFAATALCYFAVPLRIRVWLGESAGAPWTASSPCSSSFCSCSPWARLVAQHRLGAIAFLARSARAAVIRLGPGAGNRSAQGVDCLSGRAADYLSGPGAGRSEEHTSELQSRLHLVCRLLLEKKKKNI